MTAFIMNLSAFSQANPTIIKGYFKVYKFDNSFDGFHLIFIKNKENNYTILSEHSIINEGQKIKTGQEYYFELIRKIDTLANGKVITPVNYLDISYFDGKYRGTEIGMLCYAKNLNGLKLKSDLVAERNKVLFENIIHDYVQKYPDIENNCNLKPFYKINFVSSADTVKFWLAGHIGQPSPVAPLKPGAAPHVNPKKLKGVIRIKNQSFVIYDYHNSYGYQLYNTNDVNEERLKQFDKINEECGAGVINPEAWLVAIFNGKLLIIEKREPYKIQL